MFAASLVVGVVSVVPLRAMAHGGPGGGGKGKCASGGSKPGDKIDPEQGGKKQGIQNSGNGLPPYDQKVTSLGGTTPERCAQKTAAKNNRAIANTK